MAKKKQLSHRKEDMMLVTPMNKKFCMVNGRAFYIWGAGLTCLSPDVARLIMRPRREKNTYLIEDGVEFQIREDEDRDEWHDFYVRMVDKYIAQGKLYINKSEPLLKIEIQNKKGDTILKTKVESNQQEVKKESTAKQTNPFNL